MKTHKLFRALAATMVCLGSASASTWNSTTTGGQWNDSTNWTGGIPNSTGATADFTLTADYTVNLVGGPFTIGNLGVSSTNSALVINPGTLNFAVVAGMPTITFDTTRTTQPTMLSIYANLSGNQGLRITGNNRVGVYFRGDAGATSTLTGGIDISSAGNFVNFTTPGILNGNKVTFSASNNTLALGLVNSSTSNTWSSDVDLKTYSSTINSRSTGVQTLTGIISGTNGGNVSFSGANQTTASVFRLQADNTYVGNTVIGSGANHVIVTAEHANALGRGTGTTVTFGNTNSSLRLAGGITVTGKNLTLSGAGNNSEGSLQSTSGANVWSGTVSVGTTANPTVGVSAGSRLTLDGVVSGNQGLVKKGDGTLVLGHAANTYSGATTVGSGTLLVNGSIATGSGLTVKAGATLGGNGGTIAESVLVESDGTFSAGEDGVGSLSITSDLTLEKNSVLAAVINSFTLTNNSAAISGNLNFDLGHETVLTLQDIGGNVPMTNGTRFSLLSYDGTWNGGLLNYAGDTLTNSSKFVFGAQEFQIFYDATLIGGHELAIQAVPEPSSFALLAVVGCVVLAAGLWRGNRRRKGRVM